MPRATSTPNAEFLQLEEETLQLNFDPYDTEHRLTISIKSQAWRMQRSEETCCLRVRFLLGSGGGS